MSCYYGCEISVTMGNLFWESLSISEIQLAIVLDSCSSGVNIRWKTRDLGGKLKQFLTGISAKPM